MAKVTRRKKVDTVESLTEEIQNLELSKQLIDLDIQKLKLRLKFLEKKQQPTKQ